MCESDCMRKTPRWLFHTFWPQQHLWKQMEPKQSHGRYKNTRVRPVCLDGIVQSGIRLWHNAEWSISAIFARRNYDGSLLHVLCQRQSRLVSPPSQVREKSGAWRMEAENAGGPQFPSLIIHLAPAERPKLPWSLHTMTWNEIRPNCIHRH